MNLDYRHADEILTVNKNILWLGDFSAADDIQWIRNHNIRSVITVGDGFNLKYDASVRHYKYCIPDSKHQQIYPYFQESIDRINQSLRWGSVLVHCGAGVSRSSTLVIAYLMKTKMMTFLQALNFVRKKRSVICPNLGFQLQLKQYEKVLQAGYLTQNKKNSQMIEQKGPKVHDIASNFSADVVKTKGSTPFLKNTNRNIARMTLMKDWKLKSGVKNINKQEFPPLLISKSLTNSSAKGPYPHQINSEARNKQLMKIAQFRFGITNTEKWKIF